MNSVIGFFLALTLPGIVGYVWLQWVWRDAHPAAKMGYGYLLGIFLTTLILWFWGRVGLPYDFQQLVLMLLMSSLLAVLARKCFSHSSCIDVKESVAETVLPWQRILWWLLVTILFVRFSGLLMEEILRPLFPWDAWMNWAPRAKIWFGLGHWVPFTHANEWWGKSGMDAELYTLGYLEAATYPPLVSLIQLWMALGLGEWRDNMINLPWALCASAFLLAFYGQLRMLRIDPLRSMIAVYLLFSIPYLNTHVALAGYAELWLAAFYATAVMALIGWSLTRSRVQLSLVVLMAAACVFTKKPGLAWAITLLPGIFLGVLSVKVRYLSLATALAVIVFFAISGGGSFEVAGSKLITITTNMIDIPSLGRYSIEYHPVGEYFYTNILVRDNWHMLGWLLLLAIPLLAIRTIFRPCLLGAFATMSSGLMFIVVIFFYTDIYKWAVDSTTINRAIMHILPSLYYVSIVALVYFNRTDQTLKT